MKMVRGNSGKLRCKMKGIKGKRMKKKQKSNKKKTIEDKKLKRFLKKHGFKTTDYNSTKI